MKYFSERIIGVGSKLSTKCVQVEEQGKKATKLTAQSPVNIATSQFKSKFGGLKFQFNIKL